MLGVVSACVGLCLAILTLAAQIAERNIRLPAFLLPTIAMPGALSPGDSPPHPVENPGLWFQHDDYPAEALHRGQQGRVLTEIAIDGEGRVRACRILKSSGSSALDAGTCRLLVHRGMFTPAHDIRGHAIAAAVRGPPVRWKLQN